MGKQTEACYAHYEKMDGAVLYLRLFAGGVMLFHNIGKLQTYNELIDSYPSLLNMSPAATFVVVAGVECLLAVLVMIGICVRTAALLLAAGMAAALFIAPPQQNGEWLLFMGIYLFFAIAGGGRYAFLTSAAKREA